LCRVWLRSSVLMRTINGMPYGDRTHRSAARPPVGAENSPTRTTLTVTPAMPTQRRSWIPHMHSNVVIAFGYLSMPAAFGNTRISTRVTAAAANSTYNSHLKNMVSIRKTAPLGRAPWALIISPPTRWTAKATDSHAARNIPAARRRVRCPPTTTAAALCVA
jgi:hypothetical protein